MAPKKRKTKFAPTAAASSEFLSETASIDASQSQDRQAAELQEAGKKNRLKTQQRRDQRKKEILTNHEARQSRLKQDLEDCITKHDEEVGDIRRPKIARLLELVQQKRMLEERIDECQSELDQMFLIAANQLQVVLDGRVESLNEGGEMVERIGA